MLFKREKYLKKIRPFYHSDDIIKVITGVRRCGKSSLMEMIVDEIRQSEIGEDNIICLDLDKRENRKIKTPDQLEALIESKIKNPGRKYLFIDEVQNVAGFEEVINGFRSDGGFSIFITGSNSSLLSGELITKLTGRYLEFELFTFSKEYKITLIGELRHTVILGTDIFGNILRLGNAIGAFSERQSACKEQLDDTKVQLENAKAESRKPFPHEEELRTKSAIV